MPIARIVDTPRMATAAPARRAPSTSPACTDGISTLSVTHPSTYDDTTVAPANSVVPTPPIVNCRAARFSWRQMRAAPRPPTGRTGAAVEPRSTTSEGIVGGPPTPKTPVISAGILPYRFRQTLEVLIAHPGGPFWAGKDDGAWSVIKGLVEAEEDPRETARREFR